MLKRYEEKENISSFRNSGNQRQFHRTTLRIISLVKAAQSIGYSLDEIKVMIKGLPKEKKLTDKDWVRISEKWRLELTEKINSLKSIKDHLDKCIGCGSLSLNEYPLRNPKDKLASKGPGPRLLI